MGLTLFILAVVYALIIRFALEEEVNEFGIFEGWSHWEEFRNGGRWEGRTLWVVVKWE